MSPVTTRPICSGTVFIVDDDASFLRSVSRLLKAVGYTVQIFDSAESFLNRSQPELPGCLVADLQMPGLNGLDLQEALRKTPNPLPVVFMTGQGDIPTSVRAMRMGAEDFLTKLAPKEELFAAVDRALNRHAHERHRQHRRQELKNAFDALSPRELEVLSHVVRGRLNKQIAAQMGIHLRTVKLHRTNLTRKLHVQSVAELTHLAKEAGLFAPETPSVSGPTTGPPG